VTRVVCALLLVWACRCWALDAGLQHYLETGELDSWSPEAGRERGAALFLKGQNALAAGTRRGPVPPSNS